MSGGGGPRGWGGEKGEPRLPRPEQLCAIAAPPWVSSKHLRTILTPLLTTPYDSACSTLSAAFTSALCSSSRLMADSACVSKKLWAVFAFEAALTCRGHTRQANQAIRAAAVAATAGHCCSSCNRPILQRQKQADIAAVAAATVQSCSCDRSML
jgi:hypothetical protein